MDVPSREQADGMVVHTVPVAPEALPAVAPEALMLAWRRAGLAARAHRWGPARSFVFPEAAGPRRLELTDPDACCWAASIEANTGLDTLPGLALCLRLLALIDLLGRAPWAKPFFEIGPSGIEFSPRLLDAAARQRLDGNARFDEKQMRHLFPRSLSAGVAS